LTCFREMLDITGSFGVRLLVNSDGVSMTDVFISYASEDRTRAKKLAEALEAKGFSVWWDRNIIAGQTYDVVIERELETATSVVVLWSKHSVISEWVKNEAQVAVERGRLVPALIDAVKPPLEFRRKQTVDLVDWNGDLGHPGLDTLHRGISAHVARELPTQQPSAALREATALNVDLFTRSKHPSSRKRRPSWKEKTNSAHFSGRARRC
jgi:TIR domain